MALPTDTALPFENFPAIERVMQWALEDLLTHYTQPSQEILAMIPQGKAMEIIQALCGALKEGDKVGVRRAFLTLSKDEDIRKANGTTFNWLIELRNKPIPPRTGTESEEQPTAQEDPKELMFQLQPLSYFKNKPKREWGVDQIIFDRGSSIFYGPSGSGKSTFVLDMFLSRACDVLFINRTTKPAFLVWIAGESSDELYPRIKAFLDCHNIPEDQLKNFLGLDRHMPFNEVATVLRFIREVKSQLAAMGVTPETHSIAFVFDTYAKCTPGADENSTQETKIITASIDEIVKDFLSHVAIIHHANGQGKIRGNTAFKGSVDTVWLVTKEGSMMKLHCEKMRGARESDDFTVESKTIVIDPDNLHSPDSTAPVIFPSDTKAEKFTPKTQLQMLQILSENSQLTTGDWQRHCKDKHDISKTTFHEYLNRIEAEDLVNAPPKEERKPGKRVYYSLSPKGVLLLG